MPQSNFLDSSRKYEEVTKLSEYKFENCGNVSGENFIVTNLVFSPDPLVFPGTFNLSFEAELKKDVPDNLKAVVQMSERVNNQDVPLPCVGNVGSCVYDDLCTILKDVECPQEFGTANVPCKCPLQSGQLQPPRGNVQRVHSLPASRCLHHHCQPHTQRHLPRMLQTRSNVRLRVRPNMASALTDEVR
ncbi:ganglioside GM2 activator-like [Haliotis rubra]|uniref:ganglioside GM2 activator-like n=1 Tax=Haliotis rubra TaxID=36100 RepID=UPI001EE594E6|nr:ganglioside GM2 activator-like [Haliotis rubra]